MKKKYIPIVIAPLLLTASVSEGASFNWNNTILTTNLTSDGSALPTTFTFAIGALGPGFDQSDPTTWIANFIAADVDPYNETGFNEIGSTGDNAPAAAIGLQPYILGYSATAGFGTPGTEGFLFTSSNWEPFPDPADTVNPTYSVSETTSVVFGAVNGNPGIPLGVEGLSNLGSFTHGFEGERLVTPPGTTQGDFEIQAFGFAPVPEPSSSLLILLSLGGLAVRRRR